jgi:hypothetical protein
MTTEEYLVVRRAKNWKFDIIVDSNSFEHVNNIHLIKQRAVRNIVEVAKNDEAVSRIIIFGSLTRYDFNITS